MKDIDEDEDTNSMSSYTSSNMSDDALNVNIFVC